MAQLESDPGSAAPDAGGMPAWKPCGRGARELDGLAALLRPMPAGAK
jgi:hypothetical protein